MSTKGLKIDLLPTERHVASETLAFDVVVAGMGMIGRWTQVNGTGGSVTWTDGKKFETGGCDGDPERITEAIARSIPRQPAAGKRG